MGASHLCVVDHGAVAAFLMADIVFVGLAERKLTVFRDDNSWFYVIRAKTDNEMRKEELMEAVIKSDRSYAEIMAFIKGALETE